jgi:putative membrane protein
MKYIYALPHLNATLNSFSALLLITGFFLIKNGNISAHRKCMLTACVSSTLFLIGYLTYHSFFGSTSFKGQGWIRPVYFSILLTHTVLAIVIVPLVLLTLFRALRERFDAHRRIARWTLPLWLYVSVTGVIVYLLLYQIYPSR